MANPKRKISKSKRDMRRANWYRKLTAPSLTECTNCGESKLPHHACPKCGVYKNQRITDAEEA
ncbi:MAG: 50S ribosomal protein L32 [Calditrichaeota bacterium]|nr:50S ribosomal protein L32 [Calditrichota bacterium]MCB0270324.1 50S ribosomal protein L32 [Calditrichota bacterium]MCB0285784.1 50S ribosomal protein L32 [Calditrichota bacterium]MCB0301586.1 50S ribosomal protein L32 [Calditrichota bacterium]MCB9068498.1 50S ribosomal protein L32 [Calditrichia bacterium]